MPIAPRLKDFLDDQRVRYLTLFHSPAYTSQEAARILHIPGKQFAKPVLFKKGQRFLMAVVEAPDHVDLKKLKTLTKARSLTVAAEDEFASFFPECELGAMPPFGNLYDIPVYVDEKLQEDEEIIFNAGSHRDAIRMKYEDYQRIVKPKMGSFSRSA